ncbi:MAG: nucleotidyltransferase domain-containing protein, partial [Candidatus Woesearchaeota archaeon]|nr:nucleotidyltransferase domain-containing protein [Candidatus Woesearchaeota archaeon]
MPKLTSKTKALFAQVLQTISPREETRKKVLPLVKNFLAELNAKLKKHKFRAKAVLGGSYAKDTWLEGDYDVD